MGQEILTDENYGNLILKYLGADKPGFHCATFARVVSNGTKLSNVCICPGKKSKFLSHFRYGCIFIIFVFLGIFVFSVL